MNIVIQYLVSIIVVFVITAVLNNKFRWISRDDMESESSSDKSQIVCIIVIMFIFWPIALVVGLCALVVEKFHLILPR